ncbi:unnamed protein product [uncultured virus]|nr:unnamed protein product [uncultured virus]
MVDKDEEVVDLEGEFLVHNQKEYLALEYNWVEEVTFVLEYNQEVH